MLVNGDKWAQWPFAANTVSIKNSLKYAKFHNVDSVGGDTLFSLILCMFKVFQSKINE